MSQPERAEAPRGRGLRALPRNVWAVTTTSFLTDISSEMLFNLLPLFLFNVLGVRTPVIGLIEGVAESTASLAKLFSGWLSDRLGRRKALAVLGYGLSTAAKPFLYIAGNWGTVLAVRFADRLGKGVRTAPRDALVADSVASERRGLAFGLHRAGDTAGAVVGLLVALGVVLAVQRGATTLDRATFQTLVLLSLVPAALAVLVLALAAEEVPPARAAPDAPPRPGLAGLGRPFQTFLAAVVLFTLGNSADAFLILRAQNVGLTVAGVLATLVLFNLVYSLVSGPAGALSDRWGRRRVLLVGWGLYALVYLGFAAAGRGWQVVPLMAAYGLYYGVAEGAARAFVADLVPAERRGLAYGSYHAAVGLTALPASALAGVLWQGLGAWPGFGPRAPFLFGAALALLATLILLRVTPPHPAPGRATP